MTTAQTTLIATETWLELDELARACGVEVHFVRELVDEGLLHPASTEPTWRFGGDELARARRIRRLQLDFDASLQSVAVIVQLLDELDDLRARLRRAGIAG